MNFMKKNALNQQVNFILSVILMASAALLAIVLMFNAAEMENPIAEHLTVLASELEN
jgi:hypothetical protein